jgi:hypothetical protein
MGTTPVRAVCSDAVPIFLGQDGAAISCGTNPSGTFWLVGHGDASTTGALGGTDIGTSSVRVDIAASGMVLSGDWGNSGVDGCPINAAVLQADGTLAAMAMVVSNENGGGSPNHLGIYSAVTADFYEPFQYYALDVVLGDVINGTPLGSIACSSLPKPTASSVVPGSPNTSFSLAWPGVSSRDDCATNPSINLSSDCAGGSRPIFVGWNVYWSHAACTLGPLTGDHTGSVWTKLNASPLPAGANAGTALSAPSAPAGKCLFLAYNPVWDGGFEGKFASAHADAIGGAGDADGDGVIDHNDNCPNAANASQTDSDGDKIGDACDNCDFAINYDQADANGNGVGDACDACPTSGDSDGDGVCNDVDNCPSVANSSQADADGDGLGDACDPCPFDAGNDSDGDGICNSLDNCPNAANPSQLDTDGDGPGDACDPCPFEAPAAGQVGFNDKDGDGICSCDPVLQNAGKCGVFPNITEGHGQPADNCPRTPNASQTPSGLGDGLGLACEDKFGVVQARPTHDAGFGDCRIRFKTVEEWNCPRFQVVYRSPGGDRAAGVSLTCRRCTTGEGFSSAFYGGTAGAYIKNCHGGHDIYAQAVRTVTSSSCLNFVNPNPVAAVRVEKVATRVR